MGDTGRADLSSTLLSAAQLERLLEVGRRLVTELDPDLLLSEVLETARELTAARYAALGVLDAEKRELERFLTSGIDEDTRRQIGPLPRGRGLLGELIRNPKPLRLGRISEHPRSYGFPLNHPAMESFLGVPIVIRGEVFGNFYLAEKEGAAEFGPDDEQLLIVLAEWSAVAIDNARLHSRAVARQADLERAVRGLEATSLLSRELGGESDLTRVVELIAKRGRALAEARSAMVALLDEDGALWIREVAGQLERSLIGTLLDAPDSAARVALHSGRPQRFDGGPPPGCGEPNGDMQSGMIVPLRWRGAELGVLCVFDHLGDRIAFSPDDEIALESFATAAATAVAATRSIEAEMRRLSVASSEQERTRWARELHDETLQELGALTVMHEAALKSQDPKRMHDALSRSAEQVERIAGGLRGLIAELRPPALDQLGVGPAIEALVDRAQARSGLGIDLDVDLGPQQPDKLPRLHPELEATIYRAVQEGLNNVIKHANADNVRISVEERDRRIRVLVEDDGDGFDTGGRSGGYGLAGMKERATLAGGELKISSRRGGGTRLEITLPDGRD